MSPCRWPPASKKPFPATKSFTCQLAVLYLLALYEGVRLGRMEPPPSAAHINGLTHFPATRAQLDAWREQTAALAAKYASASTFLYLGRGIHYAIAREGALKLKEASYVHAEGYPVGELKHGPNALVSDRVPLVVLATVDRTLEASSVALRKDATAARRHEERRAPASSRSPTRATQVSALVDRLHCCSAGQRISLAHP